MTSADTITFQEAASLSSHERGLVVVSTLRANGTIQSSLVNAGAVELTRRTRSRATQFSRRGTAT